MTASGPTRASFQASTTTGSRCSTWPPKATPISRWTAAFGWWAMCRPVGAQHARPPPYRLRCPPPLSRPPPPCPRPPLASSARHPPSRWDVESHFRVTQVHFYNILSIQQQNDRLSLRLFHVLPHAAAGTTCSKWICHARNPSCLSHHDTLLASALHSCKGGFAAEFCGVLPCFAGWQSVNTQCLLDLLFCRYGWIVNWAASCTARGVERFKGRHVQTNLQLVSRLLHCPVFLFFFFFCLQLSLVSLTPSQGCCRMLC